MSLDFRSKLIAICAAAALLAAACSGDDAEQQQAQPAPAAAQSGGEDRGAEPASSASPQAGSQDADGGGDDEQEAEPVQEQAEQQAADQPQAQEQSEPEAEPQQQEEQTEPQQEQQSEEQAEPEQEERVEQESAEQEEAQAEEEDEAEPEPSGEEEEQQEQEEAEPQAEPEPTAEERLAARAAQIAAAGSAPELTGLTGWLSGGPTTIARELAKGNVVLIDFWTYTCINCIRTFPFLVEWHEKYAEHGLRIIGVHSPEFEFEKEARNVLDSMAEHGIEYLVAQDNDFRTWRAFSNRYWPAKYLIGPTMDVRYAHFGEGDYPETEEEIREALEEAGRDLSGVPAGVAASIPTRDPQATGQTRELYGGTHRNYGRTQYAAQPEYYIEGGVERFYTDIAEGQRRLGNKWYVRGLWRNEEEAIVHARETEDLEDYIALNFTARTVNVVLNIPPGEPPYRVYVEVDGEPVRPEWAGDDVRFDEAGNGFVTVTEDDLYRLVKLPEWTRHELKLRSNSDKFAVFAFTFGSYLGGE